MVCRERVSYAAAGGCPARIRFIALLSDRGVSAFAMSESPVKSDFGVREGQPADVAGRQRPAVDRLASAMRARARSDPQGV